MIWTTKPSAGPGIRISHKSHWYAIDFLLSKCNIFVTNYHLIISTPRHLTPHSLSLSLSLSLPLYTDIIDNHHSSTCSPIIHPIISPNLISSPASSPFPLPPHSQPFTVLNLILHSTPPYTLTYICNPSPFYNPNTFHSIPFHFTSLSYTLTFISMPFPPLQSRLILSL